MKRFSGAPLIAIALLTVVSGRLTAQTTVSLQIKVVKQASYDLEGQEVPVPGQKVYVVPFSGNVAPQSTDSSGDVTFFFPATSYVSVYIGDPRQEHKLPRMSGRYSQNTSVYLKHGGYGAPSSYQSIIEFAQDVKNARSSEEMPNDLKRDLMRIRDDLLREAPGETEERKQMLQRATDALNDAMQPVGRIGVTCVYGPNGATVTEVLGDMPAKQAGIKAGDKITKVDGRPIRQDYQLPQAFARAFGGTVEIEYAAPGQEKKTVDAQLK